jgi:hypothetical protein
MQGPKLVSQLQRRVAHMITNPVPPDETVRRHRITPEETEEHIQVCEKLLETESGDQARALRDRIDILKAQVVRMRAGTLKIWQRIPTKIQPK